MRKNHSYSSMHILYYFQHEMPNHPEPGSLGHAESYQKPTSAIRAFNLGCQQKQSKGEERDGGGREGEEKVKGGRWWPIEAVRAFRALPHFMREE